MDSTAIAPDQPRPPQPQSEPLERNTLSERVASAIKRLIIERRLGPGDKLPSERELTQYFQVSRIVIREALRSLTTAGVVRTHQGKGTFVEAFGGRAVAEHLTFGLDDDHSLFNEMLDLRLILECGAVELALARQNIQSWTRLRASLDQLREAAEHGRWTEDSDLAFHQAILESAGSRPLSRLGHVLAEFFRMRNLVFPPTVTFREPADEVLEHALILEAIENRDVETAKRRLRDAINTYRESLSTFLGTGDSK